MNTDSIIKNIVNAVKSREELKGVSFAYSTGRNIAENPVCAFTLCIGFGKAQYISNSDTLSSEFTTEVKLSLLAPSGAGGKRLSEMALWVAEAISEDLSVNSISVSEPRHRDTGNTLYCDIVISVKEESLTDTGCSIYINDVRAEGIVLFEAESIALSETKPELLNGLVVSYTGESEYNVKIKSVKLLEIPQSFELKAEYQGFEEVYVNCFVSKLKREIDKQKDTTFVYNITAKSMRFYEKEVQDVQ